MANCSNLQKSLAWCQGTPELPGIKRRIYYIAKSQIAQWPELPTDDNGRPTAAVYDGSFTLVADATWKYIDVLPDKCQVTSEAQGEVPSQTQLNKLVAVHPAIGEEATAASAYLNNSDNVFIVEDMKGKFRVIGSDRWETKCTVAQDLGQGATGTTSTTINAEASDVVPAPFYDGEIVTEDGIINEKTKWSLNLTSAKNDTGTVSPNGTTTHRDGEKVTITATPASGYSFTYWSDDASIKDTTRVITMDSDKTIIAYFGIA